MVIEIPKEQEDFLIRQAHILKLQRPYGEMLSLCNPNIRSFEPQWQRPRSNSHFAGVQHAVTLYAVGTSTGGSCGGIASCFLPALNTSFQSRCAVTFISTARVTTDPIAIVRPVIPCRKKL